MKLENVDTHLQEKLKDPYFKELYELEEQKLKIVKRIIAFRLKNKLTQTQLARRAGVTQQHISKIESGEFANIATLEKVLLLIGFTVRMKAVPLSPNDIEKIKRIISRKKSQAA